MIAQREARTSCRGMQCGEFCGDNDDPVENAVWPAGSVATNDDDRRAGARGLFNLIILGSIILCSKDSVHARREEHKTQQANSDHAMGHIIHRKENTGRGVMPAAPRAAQLMAAPRHVPLVHIQRASSNSEPFKS